MDIISNLDTTITNLYNSVNSEIFEMLDKILVITPDILNLKPLNKVLNISNESHMLAIVACFITISGICFVIQRLAAMYNGTNKESIHKYILSVIICAIIATNCMYLCKTVLNIANLSAQVVMELGETISGKKINFKTFGEYISKLDKNMSDSFLSIDGMIKGIVVFSFVNLLICLAVRYVWIIFLLLITPITIMLNISKASSGIFKSWCKSLLVNL